MTNFAIKIEDMNKIFHARIAVAEYLFLALITISAVYQLWVKSAIWAVPLLVLIIILIERFIHTTYTITTDGKLILYFGRFTRSKEILLKDIISIERATTMKIGRFALMRYVVVKYGAQGKCAVLLPVKEDAFIKTIHATIMNE